MTIDFSKFNQFFQTIFQTLHKCKSLNGSFTSTTVSLLLELVRRKVNNIPKHSSRQVKAANGRVVKCTTKMWLPAARSICERKRDFLWVFFMLHSFLRRFPPRSGRKKKLGSSENIYRCCIVIEYFQLFF